MTLRRIRWEEVQAGSGTRVSSEFSGQLNMVFWPFPSFLLDSIVLILQAWFNRKISSSACKKTIE